jgi:flagellar biosynthetic protein FliR
MPIEASSLVSYAAGFGLVGARVTGAFYFVPFPGDAPSTRSAKAILILAITLSLFSFWPLPDPTQPVLGLLVFGILKEAAIGICLGLVVSLATECLTFCFHLVGLQAGYTFASTIDPTTHADTTVLETLGTLTAGLLFFSMGLHRAVIRAFAVSLQAHPAGAWTIGPGMVEPVLRLFQLMLSTGVRLALPVLAAMVLIDIALALLSRVNSQLQLVFLAFPAKILASLLLIAWILRIIPSIFGDLAQKILDVVQQAVIG